MRANDNKERASSAQSAKPETTQPSLLKDWQMDFLFLVAVGLVFGVMMNPGLFGLSFG